MGSDDLIKFEPSSHSECQVEDNGNYGSQEKEISSYTSNGKVDDSNHIETEDFTDGSNFELHDNSVEDEYSQHIPIMDLDANDFMPRKPILQEHVRFDGSFDTLGKVDKSESKFSSSIFSTNLISNITMTRAEVDENPITGSKRARTTSSSHQPSVRVVYNGLTRESKKKLMDLMQQWSQWQAKQEASSNVPGDVISEYGEDTYFAALQVGSLKTNAVSFWLDNQDRKENSEDPVKLDCDMVPLYDRGFTFGSTTLDNSTNSESGLQALDASRCFNCGSYCHAVKDCPKPRDNAAINNARKQHSSKRNQNTGSCSQSRYYEKSSGKFDDLKAGVLGSETRECLGIGELDPPPWLHRMRQMGYPPGYLDDEEEDQPSGIIFFTDEKLETECEEGELPEKAEPAPSKKRMTVGFPGINAPIPENADNWLWANPSSSFNHGSNSNSARPSDSLRGCYRDQIEPTERRVDVPPGSVHGLAAFSRAGYSPRFSSQEHSSTPSPNLVRSLSDRSWSSSMLHESSPIHSPHPYSSLTRQPQYFTPVASIDRWSHEKSYHSSADSRERDHHTQDYYRHHHKR